MPLVSLLLPNSSFYGCLGELSGECWVLVASEELAEHREIIRLNDNRTLRKLQPEGLSAIRAAS